MHTPLKLHAASESHADGGHDSRPATAPVRDIMRVRDISHPAPHTALRHASCASHAAYALREPCGAATLHGVVPVLVASFLSGEFKALSLLLNAKPGEPLDSPFARDMNSGYEFMSQVRPSTGTADQKESLQVTAREGAMDGRWPSAPAACCPRRWARRRPRRCCSRCGGNADASGKVAPGDLLVGVTGIRVGDVKFQREMVCAEVSKEKRRAAGSCERWH